SCRQPTMNETYYVYILASGKHGTLYIGVTRDVKARIEQHRNGRGSKFVHRYKVYRLGHVESFTTPLEAIAREKAMGPGFRQDDGGYRRAYRVGTIRSP